MKRTFLLCALAAALTTAMVFPAFGAVELFRVGVANPMNDPIPKAPAFVEYTLNCTADITVEILPSDINGNPTGPAVKTASLGSQAKGKHMYMWPCLNDAGEFVTPGYYVARVTAVSNPTQWDPIIGLYTNLDPFNEYPARPTLPPVNDTKEGFYGMGVNKNPGSPYYGRIYAPHKSNRDVYMYDVDGKYLGAMNDTGISWGTSAPWDTAVAGDDYVYVSDRSNMVVYCFKPDGSGWTAKSPTNTNHRSMAVRTDPAGVTHVYSCSGMHVYEQTISGDHTSFSERKWIYQASTTDTAYGLWVAPDLSYIFQTNSGGVNTGVTKWLRQADGTYVKDTTWSCSLPSAIDVEMSADGTFLWVVVFRAYTDTTPSIYKVALDGTVLGNYDIITYGFHLSGDYVGNIGCTFGKSTPTWGSYYWGLFAEPGTTSKQKLTGVFEVTADPAPVVVPNSESWVYTDPSGNLIPNGTDTATLTFKVLDPNGYTDIGDIKLNLEQLKLISATDKIQDPDTREPDPGDPQNMTLICTKVVSAVNGVKCPTRTIETTCYDVHHSAMEPKYTLAQFTVNIAGNLMSGNVRHVRHFGAIDRAVIKAVGGVEGVYGYPFTYESPLTDLTGYAQMFVSEGNFDVTAVRTGWKTQAPISVYVDPVESPPWPVPIGDVYLGSLSVAELREFTQFTQECSVEGVCYAQPKGVSPTFAYGLEYRLDQATSAAPADQLWRRQWYMCDPGNAGEGRLFMLRLTDTTWTRTWDDPNAKDPISGKSWYIGKRPEVGDYICVTGTLQTRPMFETRVLLDDQALLTKPYKETYWNLSDPTNPIVPNTPPPAPVTVTIADIKHNAISYHHYWGKYGQIDNVIPVIWRPDGMLTYEASTPYDPVKYVVIMNPTGTDYAVVAFDSLTTLNIPGSDTVSPVDLGDTYTFKGAVSRRCRNGEGGIRVRGTADMIKTYDQPDPGANTVALVRGLAPGAGANVRGVVTLKGADYMYIESVDRSSGIRVASAPWYVNVGDDVQAVGNVAIIDGEKRILPTKPIIVHGRGLSVPALGLRTREVGGADYGPYDPGVTDGRGALNVGLLVKLSGLVTYRDTSATPAFFYIWDGANRTDAPVDDGTGNWGVRIAHSGWLSTDAVVPWTDWVEVTGVVSATDAVVTGRTIPQVIPTATPVKVTAFDTLTSPAGTVRTGWNLIGVPAAPAGVGSGDPWGFNPYEPSQVIPPGKTQDEIDYRLFRWESVSQGMPVYDMLSEPNGPFGGILLGDGYWVNAPEDWTVSYSGKLSTLYQWLAPGPAGWMLLAHPQNHPTNLEFGGVELHDGARVLPFYNASQYGEGWIYSVGYFWDNIGQGLVDIGVGDDLPTDDTLRPWYGYWFRFLQPNKSLLIP